MWRLLSDPCHAAACSKRGATLAPLGRVLSQLASRPYASKVFGHWGHDWFFIGTAPNWEVTEDARYRRILCIVPVGKRFRIGFGATPSSEWSWRVVNGKVEEVGNWQEHSETDIVPMADMIITRDLTDLAAKGA